MDYLIRFVHIHETFRQPETDALAELAALKIEWLSYSEDVRASLMAKGRGDKQRHQHLGERYSICKQWVDTD